MAATSAITSDLKNLKIDLDLTKINEEYPVKCLPTKLHKRTGKAKNCLYEDIDPNLYEPAANMITFYTHVDRILYWIKALSILYYENMGNNEDTTITWSNVPETWSDRHDSANSILIEVRDSNNDNVLKYNVTFFVTTGTIRSQGSKYNLFVEKDFPLLKEILKLLIQNAMNDPNNNEDTLVKSVVDIHESMHENPSVAKHTEQMVKGQNLNNNNPTGISEHIKQNTEQTEENLSDLQKCFVDAICKLQICQDKDTKDILQNINDCKSLIQQGHNKGVDKCNHPQEIHALQEKLQYVKEERDSLKSQLQIEKGNVTIIQSQYEDSNKHYKNLLDQTRQELSKLVQATNSELDFSVNRLTDKNTELEKLQNSEHNLRQQLDKAYDEILNLKSQISPSMTTTRLNEPMVNDATLSKSYPNNAELNAHGHATTAKPVVLLLGTSNVRGINESKLSPSVDIIKQIRYQLDEAKDYIHNCNPKTPPAAVVLHVLTNDLKSKTPINCVSELSTIVSLIIQKWKDTKCIISLATPRKDDFMHHTNGQIINALLKQQYFGPKYKKCMLKWCFWLNTITCTMPDNQMKNSYKSDLYHLNDKGVSHLASNIKMTIHQALEIPLPPARRPRSHSRNRGRGRGRGHFD